MKSKWFDKKDDAISLRMNGVSIRTIEKSLGIPRSTLSGWLRGVELKPEHKRILSANHREALVKARLASAVTHRKQKEDRIKEAEKSASLTLDNLSLTPELLDISLAMLYLGEGAKNGCTSMGSSDPKILKFFIYVLKNNYGVEPDMFRADLHLRMDQDVDQLKKYWSTQLGIPIDRFRYVSKDARTLGKPTYDHYKGVCLLNCSRIDIQRKLVYLYTQYIERLLGQKKDTGM